MVMQDQTPIELVLTLTKETAAILDELVALDLSDDGQRTGLALVWLERWSRRGNKHLSYYDRYEAACEPLGLTVSYPLWNVMREFGVPLRWWPDEVASAVVNDWGNALVWKRSHGTLV